MVHTEWVCCRSFVCKRLPPFYLPFPSLLTLSPSPLPLPPSLPSFTIHTSSSLTHSLTHFLPPSFQLCPGWNNCHSWSLWLWQDCHLPNSFQVLQLWCYHLRGLWGERKRDVWSAQGFPRGSGLLFKQSLYLKEDQEGRRKGREGIAVMRFHIDHM